MLRDFMCRKSSGASDSKRRATVRLDLPTLRAIDDDMDAYALRATVLIAADELARLLDSDHPPVVLAVRAPDAVPPGPWHDVERIPGAADALLATELAGPGGGPDGSRPLPKIDDRQEVKVLTSTFDASVSMESKPDLCIFRHLPSIGC